MTPLVSVLIPVYNDPAGIDACLAALAAQSWPRDRCEVIVLDNASKPPIRLNPTVADFARRAGLPAGAMRCADWVWSMWRRPGSSRIDRSGPP